MVDRETGSTLGTNQITTTDLASTPNTPGLAGTPPVANTPGAESLYPPQGPDPKGTTLAFEQEMAQEATAEGPAAPGTESEEVVWEARYSMKNFVGRLAGRSLLTIALIGLAIYAWSDPHPTLRVFTIMLAVVLGFFWIALLFRILQARYCHYYRLTNRRLFVSTGLLRRRSDQMELLHVKDMFTRERLLERWLSLGTVVVVPREPGLPTFYLAGVDSPGKVMDLIWHCARAERDKKAVKIDNV